MIKILTNLWAEVKPWKSSHFKVKYNWKSSVIPVHWNKDLPKWLLNAVIKQLEISSEDYDEYF